MDKIEPHYASSTLQKRDGRTKEGRLVQSLRSELMEHVGGSPSVTQRLLIDQACELRLGLATMDSDRDARTFLDWNNSLAALLKQIEQAAPNTKPAAAEAA